MQLNIQKLLSNLAENTEKILSQIHLDPKLSHRYCKELGLWIANAGKDLFAPEHDHQLYAKGIVYKRVHVNHDHFGHPGNSDLTDYKYELISLGFLKIYNFGENLNAINHVSEMLKLGADPVMTAKLDGCLDSDTILITEDGNKTIKDICENKYFGKVLSYDINKKQQEFDNIVNHSVIDEQSDWYLIELECGTQLKVTGNHKIWLSDLEEYREVRYLKVGDNITKV